MLAYYHRVIRRVATVALSLAAVGIAAFAVVIVVRARQPQPPRPVGDVAAQIRTLQTIRATEYRYRDVIWWDEEVRLFGVRTGSRSLLFSVDVRVIGGIDLTEGFDVTVGEGNVALVTLPAPRVLLADADEDSIDQYFSDDPRRRIDFVEVSRVIDAAKEAGVADAVDRGLYSRVEDVARAVVTRLLREGGYDDVRVRFAAPEELRG